ncbi:Integrator complex subunit 7 [Echinococcus granulosus]|nr:Integrator complex subunit 7 [Echinococcus granulosus]
MGDGTGISREVSIQIMEINRGLSSPILGEQCKAVAEFPRILEHYPFPVVINSLFLKITELFCSGTNSIRMCILQSCSECRCQLLKLTISDDIVRKLIPLDSSSDPNTRALNLNGIVKDNVSVHHIVMSRLESHYEVELNAAVSVAYDFASISKAFAISLCPILCDLLKKVTTTTDNKLKLIPLGEYVYHDMTCLPEMRDCLKNLLRSHKVAGFVTVICDTLTKLEIHSPVCTSNHIELILSYFDASADTEVRANLLSNLSSLADRLPNQWTQSHISHLCRVFSSISATNEEKEVILMIFYRLTSSLNYDVLYGDAKESDGVSVSACLTQALCCEPSPLSSLLPNALALACKIARCGKTDEAFNAEFVASMLVASLAPASRVNEQSDRTRSWILSDSGPPFLALKLLYFELLKFIETFPSFICIIDRIEFFKEVHMSGDPRMALLCQFLGRVCVTNLLWLPELPVLLGQLKATRMALSPEGTPDNLLQVCVLVLIVANGCPLLKEQQLDLLTTLAQAIDSAYGVDPTEAKSIALDPWIVYQLACKASLYRQPRFAAHLFEQLASLTVTLKNTYWLRGLAMLNRAQADLYDAACDLPQSGNWVPKLSAAISSASSAMLRAHHLFLAVDGQTAHRFQTAYTEIRAELLACLARTCDEAFQAGAFSPSGVCTRWQHLRQINFFKLEDVNLSEAHPLKSLGSLLSMWKNLDKRVCALIQQCVDADPSTLRHLNGILDLIRIFVQALEECGPGTSEDGIPVRADPKDLVSAASHDSFETAAAVLRRHLSVASPSPQLLIHMLTLLVSMTPSSLPTFFFVRKQFTQIYLVLIPSTNNADPLTLPPGASHVLQVMGVVTQRQMKSRCKPLRAVTGVSLILTLHRQQANKCKSREVLITKLLPVSGDFFTGEFCLSLPTKTEACRITVEATLIDEQQRRWRLGKEAGAMAFLNIRLENVAGSSSVGDPQGTFDDFGLPLSVQVERILGTTISS